VLFIVIASAVLALQPLSSLITGVVIDDALYYPKIAMSVVDGSGFSYDGQTETNGVHPLWQILWLPLASIADGDSSVLLRLGFLTSAVLMSAGFFVMFRVMKRIHVGSIVSAFILVALFFARADLFMSLMESSLTFLMIGLALLVSLRTPGPSTGLRRQRILLGITLGVMFLSRLDTVFIVAGLSLGTAYAWGAKSRREWLSHQITAGIAYSVVVTPYLLWNLIKFGNLVPVSGFKKMQTSHSSLDSVFGRDALLALPDATLGKLPGPDTGWWILVAVAITLICIALFRTRRQWKDSARHPSPSAAVIVGFTVAVLARYLYMGITLPGEVVPWYLVPDYVMGSLLVAIGLTLMTRAIRINVPAHNYVLSVVLSLLLVVGSLNLVRDARLTRNDNMILYNAGQWAKDHLPPDATAAMYDSGYFSYFSGLDTVAMNGLATDFETMNQIVDGDDAGVLRRLGVEYFVTIMSDGDTEMFPPGSVIYSSNVFPSASTYAGDRIFIIGPLDEELIDLLG